MEFCPNCGKVLTTRKMGNEVMLVCRKCGFTKTLEGQVKVVLERSGGRRSRNEVIVVDGSEQNVLPTTTDVECPECGHREAYWWTVQTRSADEPMTQFFRCANCSHTWREYA